MPKKQKYQHPSNIDRVRAENERRRSNVAVPMETRNKRLRTDERVIADELNKEHDRQLCSKCGSPDHVNPEEES